MIAGHAGTVAHDRLQDRWQTACSCGWQGSWEDRRAAALQALDRHQLRAALALS